MATRFRNEFSPIADTGFMPPDEDIVDISSLRGGQGERGGRGGRDVPLPVVGGGKAHEVAQSSPTPFLSVYFECANQYARAQKANTPDGPAYLARCPTCGKQARFLIGEGGTNRRSFRMTCR